VWSVVYGISKLQCNVPKEYLPDSVTEDRICLNEVFFFSKTNGRFIESVTVLMSSMCKCYDTFCENYRVTHGNLTSLK